MNKATNPSGAAQGRTPFRPSHGPSTGAGSNPASTGKAAFTRVDLLVVIAVVFFLCLLLTPGFARTRVNDHTFQCLNNLRVLQNAWQMYAEDNAGRVMMNTGVSETQSQIQAKTYRNWANNIMTWGVSAGTDDRSNTNVNWLLQGPMATYLRSNVTVFKCPADNFLSPAQRRQGWTARARSYSMNGFWGLFTFNPNDPYFQSDNNRFEPQYRQWIKLAQPSNPSNSWVMIEEHPDTINDGFFINRPVSQNFWADFPASFHNGAVNVTFADGHIETHLWRGVATRVPVSYTAYPLTLTFEALSHADYRWLMDRTAVPYP